jgi:hypothetical protein
MHSEIIDFDICRFPERSTEHWIEENELTVREVKTHRWSRQWMDVRVKRQNGKEREQMRNMFRV